MVFTLIKKKMKKNKNHAIWFLSGSFLLVCLTSCSIDFKNGKFTFLGILASNESQTPQSATHSELPQCQTQLKQSEKKEIVSNTKQKTHKASSSQRKEKGKEKEKSTTSPSSTSATSQKTSSRPLRPEDPPAPGMIWYYDENQGKWIQI